MKKVIIIQVIITGFMFLFGPVFSQTYIADYSVAKEEVLRSIPVEYINNVRTDLVIAYQHTSHGTHVSRGVFGLQDYKTGDDQLFGVASSQQEGKLHFRDYALQSYAPSGVDGSDLSRNETAFIQTTRNFLDATENATVNVVMWSWCNIAGHDVAGNYLPGMSTLISEYGEGGTKIGTGEGEREVPVTFIYMTGHANKNANTGSLNPKEQAALITDNCNSNSQYCLDYYSIDTHTMDDVYYEDTGDNGDSDTYGGNFYIDWQDSHTLGEDYFENKETPGGSVTFGSHNTQHITANRKGYAMWWILARIAGWDDSSSSDVSTAVMNDVAIYPNPGTGRYHLNMPQGNIEEVQIINIVGKEVLAISNLNTVTSIEIDLSDFVSGIYGVRFLSNLQTVQYFKLIHSK